MGCSSSVQDGSPHAVLFGQRDGKGRITVPNGRSKLEIIDQQMEALPEYVGTENIKKLTVSETQLKDLPSGMGDSGSWGDLSELILERNNITKIPSVVVRLPQLAHLSLAGNALVNTGSLKSLQKCSNLTKLCLSGTRLQEIPNALWGNQIITNLDLSRNSNIVLRNIQYMRELRVLDLSWCNLFTLSQDILLVEGLEDLRISGNPIERSTFSNLGSMRKLESLTVQCMLWRSLPDGLVELPLTSLDVSRNYLENFENIAEMDRLRALDLSNNCLQKVSAELAQLCEKKSLQILKLNDNYLADLEILCRSDSGDSLECLEVANNKFTRNPKGDEKVWREIARLKNLKSLVFKEWKSTERNTNPYSTKIPLPLLGLPLQHLNGIELSAHFTYNVGENLVSLTKSCYYKLDFGFDWEIRYKYHVNLLDHYHHNFHTLTRDLKTSLSRYKMFLLLQDKHTMKIIAPLDVSVLHYLHMLHPNKYARDCTNLLGYVMDNYYHGIDRTSCLVDSHSRYVESRLIWATAYGSTGSQSYGWPVECVDDSDESFMMQHLPAADLYGTDFSLDFGDELPYFEKHVAKVSEFKDTLLCYSATSMLRFQKFLALLSLKAYSDISPDIPLIPTCGILLMLHVYQCLPCKVWQPLLKGNTMNYGLRVPSSCTYESAIDHTIDIWRKVWGEEYLYSGGETSSLSPTGTSQLIQIRKNSPPEIIVNPQRHQSNASSFDPSARPRRTSMKVPLACVLEPSSQRREVRLQSVRFLDTTGV